MNSIINLDKIVKDLNAGEKEIFNRVYGITTSTGQEEIPESFVQKQLRWFGKEGETPEQTLDRVKNQEVVRIYNKYTFEGASFNALRADRPIVGKGDPAIQEKVRAHIEEKIDDDFCSPLEFTASDVGIPNGRIQGQHCMTASNSAKYDGVSGMVTFNEHDPLKFSLEQLSDYIGVAQEWSRAIHSTRQEFVYPVIGWNCLEKAAASQVHGHMQLLLGKDFHYADVEKLRKASQDYRTEHDRDYFEDLIKIYDALKLSWHNGEATVMAELTPKKEKGIMIVADDLNEDCVGATYNALRCFIDQMGVVSFNAAILMPPLDQREGWEDFPYIVRIVDREKITSATPTINSTADIGVMELFVNNIISSDPYKVIEGIRGYSKRNQRPTSRRKTG